MSVSKKHEYFVPSDEVMTTIVFPTIFFCVGMVVAMLVGINKCKQWELDKVVEMRRTRRVVQRITARLREKNFITIQKARDARRARKRAAASNQLKGDAQSKLTDTQPAAAPPVYQSNDNCGSSPPPSYEDALLDEYFFECRPSVTTQQQQLEAPTRRRSSQLSRQSRSSTSGTTRNRNSASRKRRSSKHAALIV